MRIGMEAMNANALDQAERIFTKILSATPDYTEAWNKRATVRFLKGDFVGSESDIYQVLIREPRHFGALAGLGMINMRLRDYEKALNAYERVKSINPFSTDANAIIPDLKDMLGIVDL
jgi:tetratricopeptide (TPR) repeat protein